MVCLSCGCAGMRDYTREIDVMKPDGTRKKVRFAVETWSLFYKCRFSRRRYRREMLEKLTGCYLPESDGYGDGWLFCLSTEVDHVDEKATKVENALTLKETVKNLMQTKGVKVAEIDRKERIRSAIMAKTTTLANRYSMPSEMPREKWDQIMSLAKSQLSIQLSESATWDTVMKEMTGQELSFEKMQEVDRVILQLTVDF